MTLKNIFTIPEKKSILCLQFCQNDCKKYVLYYVMFIKSDSSYMLYGFSMHNMMILIKQSSQWPLLLTWFNFNPSMDK